MNGREILVDTNIIIYLLQGDDTIEGLLQGKQPYISFITELELLGLHSATKEYEKQVESLLNDCLIISLNHNIKQEYKNLRKAYKLKLADSLIAATSIVLDIPLITSDKQFKTIKSLNLIQYERYYADKLHGISRPLIQIIHIDLPLVLSHYLTSVLALIFSFYQLVSSF